MLKHITPFAKRGGAEQQWELKFNLSGDVVMTADDAEATALDLFSVSKALASADSQLSGFLYYPAGSAVNTVNVSYTSGTHPCDASAYTHSVDDNLCQLEVVALCKAHVGTSSKGRPVFLFKHVHDPLCTSAGGTLGAIEDPATLFANWNSGSGPHDVIPVSPTTGAAPDAWSVDSALYTRQLRRGFIPKA